MLLILSMGTVETRLKGYKKYARTELVERMYTAKAAASCTSQGDCRVLQDVPHFTGSGIFAML